MPTPAPFGRALRRVFGRALIVLGLLCAAAVLAPASARAQTYSWQNVQILGGGYVSGITFHPTAPNLLYARTDVGGAYRWDNPNSRWIPLNDTFSDADSQLAGVLSLALDPSDPERLYLACGQYLPFWGRNGAILRSTDRGATWSRTELTTANVGATIRLGGNADGRNTGERLAVDPALGSRLFLGTNQDGLWKSTDHGVTWARVTGFTPASTTFVVFDKDGPVVGGATQVIYAGVNTTTEASLHRSTDGGVSWAPVVGGGPGVGFMPHSAVFDTTRVLYLTYSNALGVSGTSNGSAWKLASDGAWTNITPVVPGALSGDTFSYAGLAVKGGGATATVFVTSLNRYARGDEIWRSTQAGASGTWTALSPTDTYAAPDAPWVFWHNPASSKRSGWTTAIALDPAAGSGRVFFGTGGGIWASANALASPVAWTFANQDLEETVPRELVSPPSGAQLLSALADIGGFRHDDLNTSPPDANFWTPVGGSNTSIAFAQAVPATVVRTHSTSPAYGARSTDGGSTWTNFAAPPATVTTSSRIGQISINADATRIVWNPTASVPYFSADNGASWTAAIGVPAGDNLPVADRINPARFYVYNGSIVYVSTDGGATFAAGKTGLPTGAGRMRAVPGFEGHLLLPAGNGLHFSTDGGLNFAPVPGVTKALQVGVGVAAPGLTYPAIYVFGVVGGIESVYRSTDSAASWIRIDDDAHRYGWLNTMTGDARTFGRVYLGTGGRGIIYGEAPVGLIPDGVHAVLSVHSGKALDVSGWGTADGANVGHYAYGDSANQKWAFTHLGHNRYRITGIHGAKPLVAASFDADAAPDIAAPAANNNQIWTVAAAASGYTLTNLASGLRLEVDSSTGGAVLEAAASTSDKQQWTIMAPSTPATPAGLAATMVSTTQINLSWTAASGASSYTVKRATTSGGPYTNIAYGVSTTSYASTGLAAATTYYYVVSATNSVGVSANSAQASATTQVLPPAAPAGLAVTAGNAQVSLVWSAVSGASSYTVKRATVAGGPYAVVASGLVTTSYVNTGLANGTAYYFVVSATNAGGESPHSVQVASTPLPLLPSPWATQDIGAVAAVGSAAYTAPTFTITGSGADIWGAADEFRYVYQTASGDCSITARVVTLQNTHTSAKAGVMIRETLAAGSRHMLMAITPSSGAKCEYRTTTGGASASAATSAGKVAPHWVRVVRAGNNFSGYISTNGTTWTQVGATRTIAMSTTVYIGLPVSSHADGTHCAATFDNIVATP